MKTPTQVLADSLGLSRVTIWKALNNRPGVSPETRQRVLAAAAKQADSSESHETDLPKHARRVTLLVSRADSSFFWMRIIDQIVADLSRLRIALEYVSLDTGFPLEGLSSMLSAGKTDGVLVMNIYDRAVLSALEGIDTPKVFYDTLPGLTAQTLKGDLLLLDGEGSVEAITRELLQRGCRRIGFVGDIQYARTNLLRYRGFVEALKSAGLAPEEAICLTAAQNGELDTACVRDFLEGIPSLPDAFVCVSDYVAFMLVNLLSGAHASVPDDLFVSGYDDASEFMLDKYAVTTVHVQNKQVGRRMVHQLLYRMENPNADFEEIFILPQVIHRTANP